MKPEANRLARALAGGYERLAAWSDLLDRINVFPIADDDTGRNLRISLAPLRRIDPDLSKTAERLFTAATGNSGNIAAGFFSGFLGAAPESDFPAAARSGRDRAWKAVARPRSGTMLTAFDALADFGRDPLGKPNPLLDELRQAVLTTAETLPAMRRAGVVDAGALAVYLFFEGFLAQTGPSPRLLAPPTETFGGRLAVARGFSADPAPRYCIDTFVKAGASADAQRDRLAGLGKSLIVLPTGGGFKIHLHTDHRRQVRERLEAMGEVLRWAEEPIATASEPAARSRTGGPVHVMTDAAGSIDRNAAKELGITLLDSYLVFEDGTVPETLVPPETLYTAMLQGRKITTAQASVFERRQWYQAALSRHRHVVYLCVGSVYTGNVETALQWKRSSDPDNRFTVVDTGAASGRLAVAAMATARRAAGAQDPEPVIAYAGEAVERSREYLFLERLKYLAAGGRLSRTRGFFGDLLGKKPVISPTAEGAVKAGIVGSRKEQLAFALERLHEEFGPRTSGLVLLEYSDNRPWVADTVVPAVASRFESADLRLTPLSLTSGAHMGPGTWGVAFLADPIPGAGGGG